MIIKAELMHKPSQLTAQDCHVEKVVELSTTDFDRYLTQPLADQPFIAENKNLMRYAEDGYHCLLVLGTGRDDGVLVESEGYNWSRKAAFVPGARHIVNAQLAQAAELIIREGTQNTTGGSWCFYFDELSERMNLTVTPDNGIGQMLMDALRSRPEVAELEMTGDCFDAVFYLQYCTALPHPPEPVREPGVRLKDLLLLGLPESDVYLVHETSDVGFIPAADLMQLTASGREQYSALLNAQVRSVRPGAYGIELELGGVSPQMLMDFEAALIHHRLAEQTMGDMSM